jgi:hypothetical protein
MLLKVVLGIELPQDVESLDRRELKQSLATMSISRLVSSGAANKIEIAAADSYLSLTDH